MIKEYTEFGSQVHAPLSRVGVFLDRGSEQYVVKSRYLSTFNGEYLLKANYFIHLLTYDMPKLHAFTAIRYGRIHCGYCMIFHRELLINISVLVISYKLTAMNN